MTRPALPLPKWATDATYTSGPDNTLVNKIEPLTGEFAQGYHRTGRVPARKLNWLWNKMGAWIEYFSINMIDGLDGGIWTPTAPIIISGSHGFAVHGTFAVTTNAALFDAGILANGGINVAGSSSFDDDVDFNDTVAVTGAISANGGLIVQTSLLVDAPGTFLQACAFQGATFASLVYLNGVTTLTKELVLAGGGRVTQSVAYAPNADHVYSAGDATRIVWTSSGITAGHSYTINDATREGVEITFLNYSGQVHSLVNSGSTLITTVPALHATNVPGKVVLLWSAAGGSTTWYVAERQA